HVGPFEAEVPDQGGDVVRHRLRPDGTVDVGCPAVALQVHRDQPAAGGERGEVGPEHLDGAKAPVQEDERPAGAAVLVVEPDAVHRRVVSGRLAAPAAPPAVGLCPEGRDAGQGSHQGQEGGDPRITHCRLSAWGAWSGPVRWERPSAPRSDERGGGDSTAGGATGRQGGRTAGATGWWA